MTRRPQRPCIEPDCGRLHRNQGARCSTCQSKKDQRRNAARVQYHGHWQTFSRAARAAEPWCHCDLTEHGHRGVCGRTDDLTLDHQYARVECRSCNSAHRRNAS